MGRLLLTIVLGLGLFGVAAWYFEIPLPIIHEIVEHKRAEERKNAETPKLGEPLYPIIPLAKLPPVPSGTVDPVIINGFLSVVDKTEVSSQVDSEILFIGEQVPDGTIAVSGAAAFMAEPFHYARVDRGENELLKFYRQLREGDVVRPDQMLAMLNPSKILNEVASKRFRQLVAVSEHKAAVAMYRETDARLQRKVGPFNAGAVSREEYSAAVFLKEKSEYESDGKAEAIKLAKNEVELAEIVLKQHFIRNPIPHGNSIIKTIVRRRGETVKHMEPIFQLYNTDNLRAEGLVDVQYQKSLWRDMPAVVEPAYLDPPSRVLYAHRQEITSVAVSNHAANPLIVSASKDKSVCIWNRHEAAPVEVLFHPDAVDVVACPPLGCEPKWMLSGCLDGSIRLWDLGDLKGPVKVIDNAHQDGVTALAFSPDGKWFASGGADNNIRVWETATGKEKYTFDKNGNPHQGAVTSLYFTPQARLVSASRDNTLHVWSLHEQGPHLEHDAIAGRGGIVSQLGVSEDGRWMLFDQGKTLQILSVEDGRTMAALQKPSGATPFETAAILAPDASLMLTAGAAEGRLQLWKTPMPGVRGFEVRQLMPQEGAAVTCAAFAPNAGRAAKSDESFAVTGARDGNVYVWQIPSTKEVDAQRISNVRLSMIERALDSGVRQMRVGVELRNLGEQQRLIPGLPVTIVIDPR